MRLSLSLSLSIVIPCYNEAASVEIFYNEVKKILEKIKTNLDPKLTYEFIFIDDGSKDNTNEAVIKLNTRDKNVRLIKFSRNFGKEAAILAGLQKSLGKAVVLYGCRFARSTISNRTNV